jgi:HEAT repeat protein
LCKSLSFKWILVLLALLFLIAFVELRHLSEPRYENRSITSWLNGYFNYCWYDPVYRHKKLPASDQIKVKAQLAVYTIGTNAIPILLEMAGKRDDSTLKLRLVTLIRSRPAIPLRLYTQDDYQRLSFFGFESLKDKVKYAIPGICNLLQSNDAEVRRSTEEILADLGPFSEPAIPQLMKHLEDSDKGVRSYAIFALGTIHKQPTTVVPKLLKMLDNPNCVTSDKIEALEAIAEYGQDAYDAVPFIQKLSKCKDTEVSEAAGETLKEITNHISTYMEK